MFRNMACSLIRSVRVDEDDDKKPKVPGRIVTTLAKAKELRPLVEKLVTLARRARRHEERSDEFAVDAKRNSPEWEAWRSSDEWQQWNRAIAPAVAMRRRAFAVLRDNDVVDILFDELADRFEDRDGGYTRVVRLSKVRLGDAGQQAIIEFVGERDRVRTKRRAPVVKDEDSPPAKSDRPASPPAEAAASAETASPEAPNQQESGQDKTGAKAAE